MKDSFILYNSFYEPIKTLKNEQLGKLFRAIFNYTINGEITQEDDILIAFMFIKNQLDIDNEKYLKICERNKMNGQKGGRPKKPEKPNGLYGNPIIPKKPDNDNDNVNVNVINNTLSGKVDEIITYLNQPDTDEPIRSFTKTSKSTRSKISARLKEGFTVDDFKDVIFYKYNQWVKKPVQFNNGVTSETYYRPDTLFSTNFENYLQEYRKKSK